jgi:hypothetical protein
LAEHQIAVLEGATGSLRGTCFAHAGVIGTAWLRALQRAASAPAANDRFLLGTSPDRTIGMATTIRLSVASPGLSAAGHRKVARPSENAQRARKLTLRVAPTER